MPVITRNNFGKGTAYYVATRSTEDFYGKLVDMVCKEKDVKGVLDTPDGLEATARYSEDKKYLFLLNHTAEEKSATADMDYRDVLSGETVSKGDVIKVAKTDVRIFESI